MRSKNSWQLLPPVLLKWILSISKGTGRFLCLFSVLLSWFFYSSRNAPGISKPCLRSAARSAFQSPVSNIQPGQYFQSMSQIWTPVSIANFFLKKISRSAVRNFFAGKFVSGRGILQLPKGKKHIQQLKIPFTAQMQVRVLSASTKDAVVKQVNTAKNVLCIRPGSSIGWATDCLSEGCGFESHPGRYRITGVVRHIQ